MTAVCSAPEYGAITQPTGAETWSAEGTWWAGVDNAHLLPWGLDAGDVSRTALRLFAQRQIVHLMNLPVGWDGDGALPVTVKAAKVALLLLDALIVADNLATPQISPRGDGGLDIEWLVSGNHLSLSVDATGAVVLWAAHADGQEAFSYDSIDDGATRIALASALNHARAFLLEMSKGVRNRVSLW